METSFIIAHERNVEYVFDHFAFGKSSSGSVEIVQGSFASTWIDIAAHSNNSRRVLKLIIWFSYRQSCQLFMSVAVESAGIDYHVVLAQNALQQCLDSWQLQAELLCALMKQTSPHSTHKMGVQVLSKLRHRVSFINAFAILFYTSLRIIGTVPVLRDTYVLCSYCRRYVAYMGTHAYLTYRLFGIISYLHVSL